MNTWYKIAFSAADVASGRAIELQEKFSDLFLMAGGPSDAGMFGSASVLANDYFFSPAAAALAPLLMASYGATSCAAPRRSDVHQLTSRADAKDIPFA